MSGFGEMWMAVVNLHAGSGKTVSIWRKAEKMLSEMVISYDNRYTDCKYHATEIAYEASRAGHRRFIAVGGDGTIHEVLEGIMRFVEESGVIREHVPLSEFTLAVIPIGSGNDWIRTHGVPRNLDGILSLIKNGCFVRQDVVKVCMLPAGCDVPDALDAAPVKTSYMVNIGGVAFDAHVCEKVNLWKAAGESGKLLYVKSLLYNLVTYRPSPVSVFCDGVRIFDGQCLSIALGNGKYSGGGMRQTPDALYDDGLLDVTVIPQFPLLRIAREVPKLFNGRLLSVRELVSARSKSVVILPSSGVRELVEVDGEIAGLLPVRFDVLEDKINVLHGFV